MIFGIVTLMSGVDIQSIKKNIKAKKKIICVITYRCLKDIAWQNFEKEEKKEKRCVEGSISN